jgi:hypothetical protein
MNQPYVRKVKPAMPRYKLPIVIAPDDKICHGEPAAAQPGARKGTLPKSAKSAAARYVGLREAEESTMRNSPFHGGSELANSAAPYDEG